MHFTVDKDRVTTKVDAVGSVTNSVRYDLGQPEDVSVIAYQNRLAANTENVMLDSVESTAGNRRGEFCLLSTVGHMLALLLQNDWCGINRLHAAEVTGPSQEMVDNQSWRCLKRLLRSRLDDSGTSRCGPEITTFSMQYDTGY